MIKHINYTWSYCVHTQQFVITYLITYGNKMMESILPFLTLTFLLRYLTTSVCAVHVRNKVMQFQVFGIYLSLPALPVSYLEHFLPGKTPEKQLADFAPVWYFIEIKPRPLWQNLFKH